MRSMQIKIFPVEGQDFTVNKIVNGREATPEGAR